MQRLGPVGIVGVLLTTLATAVAAASPAGEYTFTVLRDGERIGTHRVAFEQRGPRIEIEAATDIEVTFAKIPLYRFRHQRHEVWERGRALSVRARTEEDGDRYDITVRPSGGGYVRTVNGRVDRFDASTKILAYWNPETLRYDSFFSVIEDKIIAASFHEVGRERMTLAGEPLQVVHYRMVGDENRDLWFDGSGFVAKVQFERRGSDIVYLRDQVHPRPAPDVSCTVSC